MRTIALITLFGSLLAVAGFVAVSSWNELAGAQLSWHGYLALGLGAGLSTALGVGLMALVFYSNRRGHDEFAYGASNEPNNAHSLSADARSGRGSDEASPRGDDP
jgi:hypothetical protein